MFENLRGYIETGWHTKDQILAMMKYTGQEVDERTLRNMFTLNNQLFIDGKTDMFIVHSNSGKDMGYKMTFDKDEILASIADNHSRAMAQLSFYFKVKKRVSELNQLSLMEESEIDMYELIKKMECTDELHKT